MSIAISHEIVKIKTIFLEIAELQKYACLKKIYRLAIVTGKEIAKLFSKIPRAQPVFLTFRNNSNKEYKHVRLILILTIF